MPWAVQQATGAESGFLGRGEDWSLQNLRRRAIKPWVWGCSQPGAGVRGKEIRAQSSREEDEQPGK